MTDCIENVKSKFRKHYTSRDGSGRNQVISSEWAEIQDFPNDVKYKKEKQLGSRHENVELNRYNDIVAYDQTCVKLKKVNYINANWIECKWTGQKYIATQGPKEITCRHFWQMILEHNIGVIVMLCRLREMRNGREKEKCHKYWPDDTNNYKRISSSGKLGELQLNMTSDVEVQPSIRKREIIVEKWPKKSDSQPHKVIQFQMTNWPDHGVPDRSRDVTELIRTFRQESKNIDQPILLHCSAGVGRTGTVIAIDRVKQALTGNTLPRDFTVKSLVKHLRQSRPKMVQTIDQYKFVYDNVEELLQLKREKSPPQRSGGVKSRHSQSAKRAKKKRPESTVGSNGEKSRELNNYGHGKLCRHKSQSWDGGLDQSNERETVPKQVSRNRVLETHETLEMRARAGIEPLPPNHEPNSFADSSDDFNEVELENGPGFMAAPGSPGSTTTGGSTNMAIPPSTKLKSDKSKNRNIFAGMRDKLFGSPKKKHSGDTPAIVQSYKPLDSIRQVNGNEAKNISQQFTMPKANNTSTLPPGSKISDYGKSKKAKPMLQPRWNKPNPAKDKS